MRRLLASVAVLAAVLVTPSAAFATTAPVLAGPATSNAALPATITLTWNDVSPLPGIDPVVYRVYRSTLVGPTCPVVPTGFADLSGPMVDTFTYNDVLTLPADQHRYCYYVDADDGLLGGPADSDPLEVLYDITPPAVPVVTQTGGNGCSVFTLVSATASDNFGPVTITTGGPFPYTPTGASGLPYEAVTPRVTATDAAGNSSFVDVPGNLYDPTRPPAPGLEVSTDPGQLKATLSWDNNAPDDGAPVDTYRLRTKGPQGVTTNIVSNAISSLVVQNLQLDATYEFTLDAADVCGPGSTSVRLVRLNDTTPPSLPLVAQPAFDMASKSVTLSWVPSTDNIQIDHYEIVRDGVPLSATDASVFTDTAPAQHTFISYVVRAVDTNGNEADSVAATIMTPDWTPPTAPVLTLDPPQGTSVTLRWPAARDNVGVVRYDILRDDKVKQSVTSGVRTFKDLNVPPGPHTWRVRADDDAGNSTDSAPQALTIVKPVSRAKLVSLKMVGASRGGAARYSLAGPARLLLDMRVIGTLPKAELRLYLQSGNGRITVWRGVPGSSSPRLRLHSALAHHGYVTIHLGRTFHSGRIRLVLITSGRMVIVGTGKHQPAIRAG